MLCCDPIFDVDGVFCTCLFALGSSGSSVDDWVSWWWAYGRIVCCSVSRGEDSWVLQFSKEAFTLAPILRHANGDQIRRHFFLPSFHVLVCWFPRDFREDGMRHDGEDVIS